MWIQALSVQKLRSMNFKKLTILPILFLFSFHLLLAQGPWAQGKGNGYGQVVFNIIPTYSSIFDGSGGSRESEREISEIVLSSYVELGITNNLTLGATIPFNISSTGAATSITETPNLPAGNLSSLGNVSLFGKYTIGNGPLKVALIPKVDLPTSTRSDVTGLSSGVDAYTFRPAISIGKSGTQAFYYGYFGYGLRSNEHNDFLSFGIEGGLKLSEKFTFIVNVDRLQNIDNGNPLVDSLANIETGLHTSFQEYTAFLLKFFVDDVVNDFGFFFSLGGGSNANSVASSPALSVGVFRKW